LGLDLFLCAGKNISSSLVLLLGSFPSFFFFFVLLVSASHIFPISLAPGNQRQIIKMRAVLAIIAFALAAGSSAQTCQSGFQEYCCQGTLAGELPVFTALATLIDDPYYPPDDINCFLRECGPHDCLSTPLAHSDGSKNVNSVVTDSKSSFVTLCLLPWNLRMLSS
jgi:hypothetical protein